MAKEDEKTQTTEQNENPEEAQTTEPEQNETEQVDKLIWQIDCMLCDTSTKVPVQKISGKKKASFIVVPRLICGKCYSVCTANLIQDGTKVYG